MGAKQVRFAKRRQYGKKTLGRAHLFAKIFKRVRQRMANGKSERPQPEGMEKHRHLVTDAPGAILKIAVVKTKAGINEDSFYAGRSGSFNFPAEVLVHHHDRITSEIKVTHLTHIRALDIANDRCRLVIGYRLVDLRSVSRAGQIE